MIPGQTSRLENALLFATAAFLAVTAGCADIDDSTRLANEDIRYSLPTQEFSGVTLTHSQAGETVFRLIASRLNRYDRDERAEFFGGVEIYFYDQGELSSHLISDRGEVLENGEVLVATGHVVVTTDSGTTVLTPRLRWDRETKLITNDTTVTIISEYDTLRGTGLVASDDLRMKRVLNPTGVTYRGVREGGGGMVLSPPRRGEEHKTDSLATRSAVAFPPQPAPPDSTARRAR